MTNEERKRVYEALQSIKDVCSKQMSCSRCPMRSDKKDTIEGCCRVKETIPALWTLNDPSGWRAIL